MATYFDVDKGRFDSTLVRYDSPRPVAIASTCGDYARLEPGFKMEDRKAVMDFCEQYDLRIPGLDWWDNEERKA